MKYRFFRIPVNDPDAMAEELNQFLTAHRIVKTERQLPEQIRILSSRSE